MSINKEKYRLAYTALNSSESAIDELLFLLGKSSKELKEGSHYYFSGEKKKLYNKKYSKLRLNDEKIKK